jgi:hypothetical protein
VNPRNTFPWIHPPAPSAFLLRKKDRWIAVWMVLNTTAAGLAVFLPLLFSVGFQSPKHFSHIAHIIPPPGASNVYKPFRPVFWPTGPLSIFYSLESLPYKIGNKARRVALTDKSGKSGKPSFYAWKFSAFRPPAFCLYSPGRHKQALGIRRRRQRS